MAWGEWLLSLVLAALLVCAVSCAAWGAAWVLLLRDLPITRFIFPPARADARPGRVRE